MKVLFDYKATLLSLLQTWPTNWSSGMTAEQRTCRGLLTLQSLAILPSY